MYYAASELCNGLLGTYFTECNDLMDTEISKMDTKNFLANLISDRNDYKSLKIIRWYNTKR